MKDTVKCGNNKWSISIDDETQAIEIEFHNHPISSTTYLFDASVNDLRNLGEMFLSMARKYSHKLRES